MWDLYEGLVVFASQFRLLFPQRIFAYRKRANSFLDEVIYDATACRVQIRIHATITLRRNPIKLAGSETVSFRQATLIVRTLFVVVLIDALKRATIDEQWLKARLRASTCRERAHAEIESRDHRRIHIGLCDLLLVDHLDDISIRAWHNANLINLIPGDPCFNFNGKARRYQLAGLLEGTEAYSLLIVNQDVAPALLMLVFGDPRLASERGRVLVPCFERIPERPPILVYSDQDGIGNLAGEGLIAIEMLDPVEDFSIRQPDAFMDEGLAIVVRDLIIEIFGGEGRGIKGRIARITLLDTMLLDELQGTPPSSDKLLSCYSLLSPKNPDKGKFSIVVSIWTELFMSSCERFPHYPLY